MLNSPSEKPVSLDQTVAAASAVSQGDIPGQGSGQVDHIVIVDNVDATHPLNLDYLIPSNFQRLLSARLSFKLRAFRSYVQAVNNLAVTTSGGSAHHHSVSGQTASAGTSGNSSGHTHSLNFTNGTITNALGLDVLTNLVAAGAAGNFPTTGETATHTHPIPSLSVSGATSTDESAHTHQVTSNVTLTYGVFEGAVATSVTVKIDGTDITAQLAPAGPYTTDKLELDLRPFMIPVRVTPGVFHTLTLTPSGLGRIHGFLRLQYFVDGQIG